MSKDDLKCLTCKTEGRPGRVAMVIGRASKCKHPTSTPGYSYCDECGDSHRACIVCAAPLAPKKSAAPPAMPRPKKKRPAKIRAKRLATDN